MSQKVNSNYARLRRHKRVRKKVSGTAECPRLNVFRSLQNIYAQLIDDQNGVTLAAASSMDASMKSLYSGNKEVADKVGALIAEKAQAKGIKKVVFDRGGYAYHGRVQALAEAARKGGLDF